MPSASNLATVKMTGLNVHGEMRVYLTLTSSKETGGVQFRVNKAPAGNAGMKGLANMTACAE
eukprot:6273475-Amphidinium_carterae.2